MNIPFEEGASVFGYGRDSGGEQQDLSIEQQEAALRKFCTEHRLVLTHFYKDEARKGSSLVGRDDLQALMREFRHGCEERGVIVWKYNRFARSVDNAQYYRAEIRTLGYVFYSITDNVPDGPMGRLFEAAIDFKDEQFLLDLSMDIKRGLGDLVRVYGCVPGKPPIGFTRQPVHIGAHRDGSQHIAHRWVPDPSLSNRILRAFEMRASHHSLVEIQRETRLFHSINSWKAFFSNPIYTGILQYGDQRIEDYCSPVVPRPLWDSVQDIQNNYKHRRHLTSLKEHPRRANSRYLLSGLAFCGICGSPLFGHSNIQRNNNTVDSYHCGRHYRNRDCSAKRLPKSDLENLVISTLRDYIMQSQAISAAYDSLSHSSSSRLAEQVAQRRSLTNELATIKRQLNNIADAIAQNGTSVTLNERLAELEVQRKNIEARITDIDVHAIKPVPKLPIDKIELGLTQIQTVFHQAELSAQRQILRAFIDRITVQREGNKIKGIIYYYYPPPIPVNDPKADAPGEKRAVPISLFTPGALHEYRLRAVFVFQGQQMDGLKLPRE